jgi:hypothetical protein
MGASLKIHHGDTEGTEEITEKGTEEKELIHHGEHREEH